MRLFSILVLASVLGAGTLDILKRGLKDKYFVYVATHGNGIASFRFDPDIPELVAVGTTATPANPAWLTAHPGNQLLYAISDDTIFSFAVNTKTGALRAMNNAPSRGTGGCHLAMEKNGWMLLATNCTTGNVVSFRMEGDGGLGPSMDVRPSGMARAAVVSPDNFFVFVADFADKIFDYRFNPPEATFWPNDPASMTLKAGSGPRRIAFRPDEKFAYSANEKGSAISVLRYDHAAGKMAALVETVSAPSGPSEIAIEPTGRYLYVSGRGDDTLGVFAIDAKRGTLKSIQTVSCGGKGPGTFRIDPSGRYLVAANEASNTLVVFDIDHKTGMLTQVGKAAIVPGPVSLVFVTAAA